MATRWRSPPERRRGRRSSKGTEAEEIGDVRELLAALGPRGEPAAVGEVLAHGEMGEEPALLEDVADAPAVHGQVDAA